MAKKQFFIESELVFKEKSKDPKFKDRLGQTYGKLVVIGFAGQNKCYSSFWYCRCECGNVTRVKGVNLTSGNTSSCGCLNIQARTKHGHAKVGEASQTYTIWSSMLQRCQNTKAKAYKDYGARGITVCERWLKFENFLADMGERPEGLTLDRRDNDGDYCLKNCHWATDTEQANNRRNNCKVTFKDETKNIGQWASKVEMAVNTLWRRLFILDWPIEKALMQPVRRKLK